MAMIVFYILVQIFGIAPCVYEDGSTQTVCHWNAQERDNGQGNSFIFLDGRYFYFK